MEGGKEEKEEGRDKGRKEIFITWLDLSRA